MGDILSEKSDWSKFRAPKEVLKLMKEIEKKAENPETQLEALELIETNIGKLPYRAFEIVSTLAKSEDVQIQEKANQVLEKYYERFPQLKEFEKSVELIKASLKPFEETMKILTNQDKFIKAINNKINLHEIHKFVEPLKSLAEFHKRWNETLKKLTVPELPKISEIVISPSPEVIVLQRIEEIEQKLEELKKEIEELKESKQIEKEEYEKLKRKLKELEEELDKAYH